MLISLRNYLARHPALFAILRKLFELNFRKEKKIIRDVFGQDGNYKVLDIGCGTGEYYGCFIPEQYTGIDISPKYIAYAKKTKKGNFLVMDAAHLSFPNESFDVIFISAVLHHLSDEDVEKVLKEARRVLKSGGKILIMEDAKIKALDSWFVRFIQKFDLGVHIRTPDDYKKMYLPHFALKREWQFRNGACTYYAALMEK